MASRPVQVETCSSLGRRQDTVDGQSDNNFGQALGYLTVYRVKAVERFVSICRAGIHSRVTLREAAGFLQHALDVYIRHAIGSRPTVSSKTADRTYRRARHTSKTRLITQGAQRSGPTLRFRLRTRLGWAAESTRT